MLPVALRVNREVRQEELARLAHLLFGKGPSTTPEEAVETLIQEISTLCDRVGVPRRLSQLGVTAGDKFEVLHRIPLGEPSYATPAVAGGVMYLRTSSHLFSLGGPR